MYQFQDVLKIDVNAFINKHLKAVKFLKHELPSLQDWLQEDQKEEIRSLESFLAVEINKLMGRCCVEYQGALKAQCYSVAEEKKRKVDELYNICFSSGFCFDEGSLTTYKESDQLLKHNFEAVLGKFTFNIQTFENVDVLNESLLLHRPREVLRDIIELSMTNPQYQTFMEAVHTKLRQIFKQCLEIIPDVDFSHRERFKLQLESILKLFPEKLESQLGYDMSWKWEKLKMEESARAETFHEWIKDNKFVDLNQSISSLTVSQKQASVKLIKEELLKKAYT